MVSIKQVGEGVAKYLDTELMTRLDGWRKWVAGAAISLAIENSENVYNAYKDNQFIQALGVIDEGGDIDIELLHDHFLEQAKRTPATFTLPFIGTITLKASDIDKLYGYITEV